MIAFLGDVFCNTSPDFFSTLLLIRQSLFLVFVWLLYLLLLLSDVFVLKRSFLYLCIWQNDSSTQNLFSNEGI